MHAFSTQNTYTHIHTHTTPSFSQQNSHQTNKTKGKKRLTFLLVLFSHPCNLPKAGTSLSPATHLAFTFYFTQAMSSSGPSPSTTNFQSPSLTIVLAVILLIFFILGFLSVYFCRCFMESLFNSWNLQRTPSGNLVGPSDAANHGLDPIFIKSFPTFIYSTIKDFRKDKYGLECAICLVEFEDDSLLRLLTLCYHVFHQECIDLWLESHTTCPVCRRNLDSPPAVEESPLHGILGSSNNNNNDSVIEGAISIEIREDDNDVVQEGREGRSEGDDHNQQQKSSLVVVPDNVMADNKGEKVIQEKIESFSRSHSTGHSIVRTREEDDQEEEVRHTLRVPEHVRLKLIRGHYHYWTGSCTTYGELSRRHKGNCGGFGEVSGCACAAGDINKK